MDIDEQALSGIDLNLLLVFIVLFRELSVSKTAVCLNVTQPAVSGSLARLRKRFNDRLFVPVGPRGVRPTAKASEIAQTLLPALNIIQTVVNA
ncbi:LysR family transcriptional regulator [Pseudomonas sp. NPDC088368]|uniref:LysR family transcriptional regulator n=1 Tax=Pseudomonas sp. NPDC088368 TaxID=3364453 RepID=UPI00380C6438